MERETKREGEKREKGEKKERDESAQRKRVNESSGKEKQDTDINDTFER